MAPLNSYEQSCFDNAAKFVAVRGTRDRTRTEFPTYKELLAYASTFGDRRTMLYAVTALGHAAHIGNV